jgi:hypothetical protein
MRLQERLQELGRSFSAGGLSAEEYRHEAALAIDTLTEPCSKGKAMRGRRAMIEGVVTEIRPQYEDLLALVDGHLVWVSMRYGARDLQVGQRVRVSGCESPMGLYAMAVQTGLDNCLVERRSVLGVFATGSVAVLAAAVSLSAGYFAFLGGIGPPALRWIVLVGCGVAATMLASAVLGLWATGLQVALHVWRLRA